jgi:hypothetical protein
MATELVRGDLRAATSGIGTGLPAGRQGSDGDRAGSIGIGEP